MRRLHRAHDVVHRVDGIVGPFVLGADVVGGAATAAAAPAMAAA